MANVIFELEMHGDILSTCRAEFDFGQVSLWSSSIMVFQNLRDQGLIPCWDSFLDRQSSLIRPSITRIPKPKHLSLKFRSKFKTWWTEKASRYSVKFWWTVLWRLWHIQVIYKRDINQVDSDPHPWAIVITLPLKVSICNTELALLHRIKILTLTHTPSTTSRQAECTLSKIRPVVWADVYSPYLLLQ